MFLVGWLLVVVGVEYPDPILNLESNFGPQSICYTFSVFFRFFLLVCLGLHVALLVVVVGHWWSTPRRSIHYYLHHGLASALLLGAAAALVTVSITVINRERERVF